MSRRRAFLALGLLAFSLVLVLQTLFAPEGFTRRQKVRADLAAIRSENQALEGRVALLRSQIRAMQTRPEVQERVIRDELGYLRPDEIVLDLGAQTLE